MSEAVQTPVAADDTPSRGVITTLLDRTPRPDHVPVITTRRAVRNWGRNEACVPAGHARPETTAQVLGVVRDARARAAETGGADARVKVIGAGHSFTPIAMTNGTLVHLGGMDRVVEVDRAAGRVTVQAGIRLRELSDRLAAVGLALPNLGDINVQSLAGAISTATHGTGLERPNIGAAVVGLELVSGTGDVIRCSTTEQPEILRAARAGLGALGVITEVTLQCVPAFNLHARETVETLDEVLADFGGFAASADHAELYWMPGSRRCLVKRNDVTDRPAAPPSRLAHVRDKWLGENLGFGLICRVGRRFPSLAPKVARVVSASASERDFVDRSDRVFSSPRHVRFVEMEYGISIEHLPAALDEVRRLVGQLDFPPLFPIEVRVSAPDDAMLSTGHGRTSAWVAVHQYRGAPHEAYFHAVEEVMARYDGRPHWGKVHYRTAAQLAPLYPDWDRFAAVRAELDPDGLFRNQYLDRVLGPVRGV